MNFNDFQKDKKTINATAFLIGQIGELTKRISNETMQENPEIPWRNVKGMRNRIIHDYENVDISILWITIEEGLPILSREINNAILHENESSENSDKKI